MMRTEEVQLVGPISPEAKAAKPGCHITNRFCLIRDCTLPILALGFGGFYGTFPVLNWSAEL